MHAETLALLRARRRGDARQVLERAQELRPAVGVAGVVERVDADEDVARARGFRHADGDCGPRLRACRCACAPRARGPRSRKELERASGVRIEYEVRSTLLVSQEPERTCPKSPKTSFSMPCDPSRIPTCTRTSCRSDS